MAEHRTVDAGVVGSKPIWHPIKTPPGVFLFPQALVVGRWLPGIVSGAASFQGMAALVPP